MQYAIYATYIYIYIHTYITADIRPIYIGLNINRLTVIYARYRLDSNQPTILTMLRYAAISITQKAL